MIYNFNLGIGWASSGVEYAQVYRANIFRRMVADAKFIFTDLFWQDNIEHLTKNIGLLDEEVIWLYQYFTDFSIAPTSYTLEQLKETIAENHYTIIKKETSVKIIFPGNNNYWNCYPAAPGSDRIHRVEYISNGNLIRQDYFSYARMFSEFYEIKKGTVNVCLRRFYNENGSVAYDEIPGHGQSMFRFPDKILYSKEELLDYFIQCLHLSKEDLLLLDRSSGIAQSILKYKNGAGLGVVIHADHYSKEGSTDTHILWNQYYEYVFQNSRKIDFFITSTEEQANLLGEQFRVCCHTRPQIVTIPVGSLDQLRYSFGKRRKHSFVTASRLAPEKHIDWLISAVVLARRTIPDITLDIYGRGSQEEFLRELIREYDCGAYIKLCGHSAMEQVYEQYEGYLTASLSEGFGLTLMEAVGSGLAMIGFDVCYGNQTFIKEEKNGYLIPVRRRMKESERILALANRIIRLCKEDRIEKFQKGSYQIAGQFLTSGVERMWQSLLEDRYDTFIG